MRGLKNKVFVIAGGGSGIGAATAQRLAEEGAAVVVGDLHQQNARQIVAEIVAGGGKALAVQFDITNEASVRALVAAAVDSFGGLDGMHVNAADLEAILSDTDAASVSLEIFERTLAVNLRGHLLCTRHALPALLKRGGGGLVYTSSGAAFMGEPQRLSYAVSKNGLHGLMRHVATRWGKQGVRANAVAPGLVMTDAVRRGLSEQERQAVLSATRSSRLGEPRDIAAAVAFLLSADAEWINGQVLSVDGGVTMR
ncbi:MAG TPA: SDR family oxidoreductase [Steroidobacter sp.]|jgi:NAD(P)-dependent dehydrogenase (short-subunit alcohol dehydrogenase family)|nr:SDR family oxidoreductase [Steroidobacteraceae bacterium]HLS83010.1 SDR family oxidoreductase [Steroidobacter sp.]